MCDSVDTIKNLFYYTQHSIIAIGDETRQAIIVTLMDDIENGMRVGEITKRMHLSRPAVSHHLKILKEANIISIRKDGTMNYYYLNPDIQEIETIQKLCETIINMMRKCRR